MLKMRTGWWCQLFVSTISGTDAPENQISTEVKFGDVSKTNGNVKQRHTARVTYFTVTKIRVTKKRVTAGHSKAVSE